MAVRFEIRSHLRGLVKRIAAVDRQLRVAVQSDDGLRHHAQLQLRSLPGIGPIVSYTLLAISGNWAS